MTAPESDPWQVFVAGVPAPLVNPFQAVNPVVAGARVAGAVTAALVLLGAPVGLIWARVSPRIAVSFSAQGPSLDHPESSEFFAADGTFLIVLLLAGLVSGALVWRFTRGHGVGVPVGLAAGGLLGGLVARSVGERVVVDSRLVQTCRQAACDIYDGTLQVRSPGLIAVWAVVALVVLVALTAILDAEPAVTSNDWPAPDFDWRPSGT